jgi:hypothetical protein
MPRVFITNRNAAGCHPDFVVGTSRSRGTIGPPWHVFVESRANLGRSEEPDACGFAAVARGALITTWEDHSRMLPGRRAFDLMLEFRHVPFVRLADSGG